MSLSLGPLVVALVRKIRGGSSCVSHSILARAEIEINESLELASISTSLFCFHTVGSVGKNIRLEAKSTVMLEACSYHALRAISALSLN
jgi:hypothetical protein